MTHRAPVIYNRTHGSHGAAYVSPVARVICKSGDITELARLLGCSQPLVSHWLVGRKNVSERYALLIEEMTGIKRQVLRPDIWRSDGRRRKVKPKRYSR